MKIVVLDPVRAILESDEGQTLVEAANKEMEPEQEELRQGRADTGAANEVAKTARY